MELRSPQPPATLSRASRSTSMLLSTPSPMTAQLLRSRQLLGALTSATAALNHLHTTLNSHSLSSKVSPDNQLQGLSSTLSSFSFTPTNTLVGASWPDCEPPSKDSIHSVPPRSIRFQCWQNQADLVRSYRRIQLLHFPVCSGAMTGIGQAQLGSDNLTNQVINSTVSVITGLIGKFENQLASTSSSSQSTSQGLALTSGTTSNEPALINWSQ